jgi:hypothetical protein
MTWKTWCKEHSLGELGRYKVQRRTVRLYKICGYMVLCSWSVPERAEGGPVGLRWALEKGGASPLPKNSRPKNQPVLQPFLL